MVTVDIGFKMSGGVLYDRNKYADWNYNRRCDWKLKPVKANCFELYARFLATGSNTLLHNAERLI